MNIIFRYTFKEFTSRWHNTSSFEFVFFSWFSVPDTERRSRTSQQKERKSQKSREKKRNLQARWSPAGTRLVVTCNTVLFIWAISIKVMSNRAIYRQPVPGNLQERKKIYLHFSFFHYFLGDAELQLLKDWLLVYWLLVNAAEVFLVQQYDWLPSSCLKKLPCVT